MRLVACQEPEGPLEAAPATALLDEAGARVSACFWARDDRWYARVERDGRVVWLTLENAGTSAAPAPRVVERLTTPARRIALVGRGGADRPMRVWTTGGRRRG